MRLLQENGRHALNLRVYEVPKGCKKEECHNVDEYDAKEELPDPGVEDRYEEVCILQRQGSA